MADAVIYQEGHPKGVLTVQPETPVGVTVTFHNPATGKTDTKTKKKGEH